MSLFVQSAAVASAAGEHGNVAAETFIYGVIAAVVFGLLALVTVSFKNVANRHSHKADAWAARNGQDAPHSH